MKFQHTHYRLLSALGVLCVFLNSCILYNSKSDSNIVHLSGNYPKYFDQFINDSLRIPIRTYDSAGILIRELYLPLPKTNIFNELVADGSRGPLKLAQNGIIQENNQPVLYKIYTQSFGYWNDDLDYFFYHYLLMTYGLTTASTWLSPDPNLNLENLFSQLKDPFTQYFSTEEASEVFQELTSTQRPGALGILIEPVASADTLQIKYVVQPSPAYTSGLRKGDKILRVNQESVLGPDIQNFGILTQGDSGVSITLEVLKKGIPETVQLIKAPVIFPTVYTDTLQGVPYIRVLSFKDKTLPNETTLSEWIKALKTTAKLGTTLIDLRGNGGGLVNTAQDMLDELYSSGTIFIEKQRYGYDFEKAYFLPKLDSLAPQAKQGGAGLNRTFIFLCDSGSASASEIVLGSVRDRLKAVLVGEKTYGKGIGQLYLPSPQGSLGAITSAQFTSPQGINYHKVGITPDIQVPSSEAITRAISEVKKNMVLKTTAQEIRYNQIKIMTTEWNGLEGRIVPDGGPILVLQPKK